MNRPLRHAGLVPVSTLQPAKTSPVEEWTPEQVRGDGVGAVVEAQELLGISLEGSVG
jgi:hypothetical protein